MSSRSGKVKNFEIEFLSMPTGSSGNVSVKAQGKAQSIRYQRDGAALTLYFDDQIAQFALTGSIDDEGRKKFSVRSFGEAKTHRGLAWVRELDRVTQSGQSSAKAKGLKLKSQMPGKIVKIMVAAGQKVEVGTPLVVMEAMKMENEIRSTIAGVVKEIKVQPGQAVETGALLISIEN